MKNPVIHLFESAAVVSLPKQVLIVEQHEDPAKGISVSLWHDRKPVDHEVVTKFEARMRNLAQGILYYEARFSARVNGGNEVVTYTPSFSSNGAAMTPSGAQMQVGAFCDKMRELIYMAAKETQYQPMFGKAASIPFLEISRINLEKIEPKTL